MQLAVTIKGNEDLERIRPLIEGLRKALTDENVTVLEAPTDLDYGYPFPVVTISDGPDQVGSDALAILERISDERSAPRGR